MSMLVALGSGLGDVWEEGPPKKTWDSLPKVKNPEDPYQQEKIHKAEEKRKKRAFKRSLNNYKDINNVKQCLNDELKQV